MEKLVVVIVCGTWW